MNKLVLLGLSTVLVGAPAAGQQPDREWIEVLLSEHSGRLFVPVVAADGTEFAFVLSTGTTTTVLTESTAASLGQASSLSLGGLPVLTANAATVADDDLVTAGRQFDGMIGPSTMNAFDMLVDLPGRRLVLKRPGTAVDWPGVPLSAPVRLQVYHGVVVGLEVELAGRPYRATLDLGTPTLVVNDAVQDQLGLEPEDEGALTIGDRTFGDLPLRVLDVPILDRWDPNGVGFVLVGAIVAHDCAISVSWIHKELRTCAP